MADLTQTITNSLNLFGGSPTSLWNSWNWNAFKWGEGTADLPVDMTHLISNSLSSDSAISQKDVDKLISESLASTSDMTSETLEDGSGWFYVFPSNVKNHESQAIPSYTSGSTPSGTWTSASAGSTSWS